MLVEEMMDQNCWANLKLLEFCKSLTPEQLATDASGTFGTLSDTLMHTVRADAGYLYRLGIAVIDENPWERSFSIEEMIDLVHKCREGWRSYFGGHQPSGPIERAFGGDLWIYGREVVIVQAFHHGSHHRAEATVNLSLMGLEPPGLSAWEWGIATGRMKNLGPADAGST